MANNQSVRRHLGCFTRGRIIGKLDEGRSRDKVWLQFGDCSQHRFTTLETNFKRTAIRGFSKIVHEEPHPQMTGTLSYRPEETDESRFSLNSDSHRILIWREREAAIIPRTSLKGTARRLAARTLPPVMIQTLRLALQDGWAAMPQQTAVTFSFSAWADAVKPA
ncbi:hypothetical protein TNCV_657331 [Trichonephila clavipes]|nr:hypothetical protein TNCV_657331 [Trichonephila clavipes]